MFIQKYYKIYMKNDKNSRAWLWGTNTTSILSTGVLSSILPAVAFLKKKKKIINLQAINLQKQFQICITTAEELVLEAGSPQ